MESASPSGLDASVRDSALEPGGDSGDSDQRGAVWTKRSSNCVINNGKMFKGLTVESNNVQNNWI